MKIIIKFKGGQFYRQILNIFFYNLQIILKTVKIINQEHIPFAFNFTNTSVKGSPDYGDSLKVTPMSGIVPAYSDLPIEI